jgi:SAM-dependent methyltransferase
MMQIAASTQSDERLAETRRAFDSVADEYDGPAGNNALIQRMRAALWRSVEQSFPRGARLLDLGCGTGIDAAYFATRGYSVVAADWSPRMVARAGERADAAGLAGRVTTLVAGAQELARLELPPFDGIYSNLGPLNCAADLEAVAAGCAALLKPGGRLIASVIGRVCPWELAYYTLRGELGRAWVRARRGMVPVGLNDRVVWTRYYTPREFYRAFAARFELASCRGLSLFLPPPYLVGLYEGHPRLGAALAALDDRLGGWPVLRGAGDDFLITLSLRAPVR